MIECLEADPALGRRYQFWTFSYASGDSIPFSAHLLRQSLRRARRIFDPDGTDAAFDRMVVVGHSLGGILAKMMVQDSGSRLWQTVCERPIDQDRRPARGLPAPPAGVLLRAPAGGAPGRLHRDAPSRQPARPAASSAASGRGSAADRAASARPARRCWTSNEPDCFAPGFRGELPTSVGELASGHPLLVALCDLGIDPSVRSHSIIADLRDPPGPGATDGIVPYSSSHLECAASELLFHGTHICLDDPVVIREVRRILVEHAGINPTSGTDHGDLARNGPESAEKMTRLPDRIRDPAIRWRWEDLARGWPTGLIAPAPRPA